LLIRRRGGALALGLALAAAQPGAAAAQVFVELGVGAAWSSNLVRDTIADGFTVQPALAPTLGLSVGTVLSPKYEVAADVRWARSNLQLNDDQASRNIIPLTVWTGTVSLRWRLKPWALAQAKIGAVKYKAAEEGRQATLFRGDQPLEAAVGLGARVEYPVGRRWAVGFDVGWDLHRFITQALSEDEFSTGTVHRVSVAATLRWRNAQ
jgi:hypothetical protein